MQQPPILVPDWLQTRLLIISADAQLRSRMVKAVKKHQMAEKCTPKYQKVNRDL